MQKSRILRLFFAYGNSLTENSSHEGLIFYRARGPYPLLGHIPVFGVDATEAAKNLIKEGKTGEEIIAEGRVRVNGQIITEMGTQVEDGDRVEVDGALYYVSANGKVIKDRQYYITNTNGLKAKGTYTFDANGKMIVG